MQFCVAIALHLTLGSVGLVQASFNQGALSVPASIEQPFEQAFQGCLTHWTDSIADTLRSDPVDEQVLAGSISKAINDCTSVGAFQMSALTADRYPADRHKAGLKRNQMQASYRTRAGTHFNRAFTALRELKKFRSYTNLDAEESERLGNMLINEGIDGAKVSWLQGIGPFVGDAVRDHKAH